MNPHFVCRADKWADAGNVKHIAGIEDLTVASATYHAACKRWPGVAITLRQGADVIEDNQRSPLGILFCFLWSDRGRKGRP